jgi:hypothetical protein
MIFYHNLIVRENHKCERRDFGISAANGQRMLKPAQRVVIGSLLTS